jgi:hypothetical protein
MGKDLSMFTKHGMNRQRTIRVMMIEQREGCTRLRIVNVAL